MGDPQGIRTEIHRTITAAQERFTYFFLAASVSAGVFAVIRTDRHAPAAWMLPIGLSLACWGTCFYLGCEHLLLQYRLFLLGAVLFLLGHIQRLWPC